MTLRATRPLPPADRSLIAALVQLHQETHPAKIGSRFGISARHVRRLWTQISPCERPRFPNPLLEIVNGKS